VKNVVQRKSSGPLEYLLYPYFEKLKLIIVRLGFVRMVLPPKLDTVQPANEDHFEELLLSFVGKLSSLGD
jgi:hypothetical protein